MRIKTGRTLQVSNIFQNCSVPASPVTTGEADRRVRLPAGAELERRASRLRRATVAFPMNRKDRSGR